ncbi:hypothetical protein Tco_0737822 [Tanacetum coccineum]
MTTSDLNGPCLSNLNPAEPKTNDNVKIEISKELLMELRNNAYNGAEANDAEKGYDNDTLIYDEESSDDKSHELDHQDTNLFFNPYLNDKDNGNKSNHMEYNDNYSRPKNFVPNDAPQSGNTGQPNQGMCRVDKFEVIKYSIGDNEEFLGIHSNTTLGLKPLIEYPLSTLISSVKRMKGGWYTAPSRSYTREKGNLTTS